MKMHIKHIFIGLAIMFIANRTIAQDYHLSQYDMTVQYLNPALTGVIFDEYSSNYRANATYRNQWSRLNGTPFTTMVLGYDMSYQRFGIGGFLYSNRTGAGNLNTFNFLLSGSYQIMDKTDEHSLSVGLQMGVLNKSLDPNRYLFDSQYSVAAGGLDPNLPSGEAFDRTGIWRFDSNLGMFYRYNDKSKRAHPYAGLSVYHLNRPNESFYQKAPTPMRFTFHGGAEIKIDEKWSVNPNMLFMQQAKAKELYIGAIGSYKINETDYSAMGGIAFRNKDAFIVHLGVKQKGNMFRISYDYNTSYLKNYSRGFGAIEFGLVYTGIINRIPRTSTQL